MRMVFCNPGSTIQLPFTRRFVHSKKLLLGPGVRLSPDPACRIDRFRSQVRVSRRIRHGRRDVVGGWLTFTSRSRCIVLYRSSKIKTKQRSPTLWLYNVQMTTKPKERYLVYAQMQKGHGREGGEDLIGLNQFNCCTSSTSDRCFLMQQELGYVPAKPKKKERSWGQKRRIWVGGEGG
ncbi:hypothetical protein B0H34DRAFT_691275 [Crassisporium funariophilum]|nr:hypothetical protein B0H34DRAFT_691275 [Crassisporium funariophilum]